jgi:oligopeptidase A
MVNPLLFLGPRISFDRISAEHVVPAIEELLSKSQRALDAIAEAMESPGYENTLGALERATEGLETAMNIVEHLESVATTPALREAYNAVLPKVSDFWSGIPLHAGLYARLTAFSESAEARTLDATRGRLLKKTLDEFKRHGAELDEVGKQRLREIDQELSRLTTKYSENLLDATVAFELVVADEARLSGLPPSARDAARDAAKEKGVPGHRFTLQEPSRLAVLTYADDRALRETIWRAFNGRATVAPCDNRPLIVRILKLRRDKAKLLGFDNFAELVLEDRMAKRSSEARRFVQELTQKTGEAFEREKRELLDFANTVLPEPIQNFEPWDVMYFAERQRRARYDFDEEVLRAYFPLERVLEGAFETARRLFGVRIDAAPELSVWHPMIRGYGIFDGDGTRLGWFYVDPYPRETKRDGAWMHGLVTAVPPSPQVAVFCMNGNPPAGGKPSLLSHRDVETLFHEFGHLLHHCLSRVSVRSLSGTRVAQDFVELPSQIMENWCSEREGLDLFARHYETGAPIEPSLLEKLIAVKTYRAGTAQMRQLGFAAADLALHLEFDPDGAEDVVAFANRILAEYSPTPLPEDYSMIAGFGHLFAHPVGYAAGYYSYKWAEVLDADAFSRFKESGVFDAGVGREFRTAILERGDSEDPMALFQQFMGRPPRLEPLLERQGLLQ